MDVHICVDWHNFYTAEKYDTNNYLWYYRGNNACLWGCQASTSAAHIAPAGPSKGTQLLQQLKVFSSSATKQQLSTVQDGLTPRQQHHHHYTVTTRSSSEVQCTCHPFPSSLPPHNTVTKTTYTTSYKPMHFSSYNKWYHCFSCMQLF